MKKVIDLTGKKFGKLTVISKAPYREEDNRIIWRCRCNCGKEIDVKGIYLTTHQTKSCGCIKKEQENINLREKYNAQYVDGVNKSLLKSKKRKDNKSGVKGVSYHKATGKWDANIGVKGKQIFLGRFKNLEDAIKARKEGEEKYHKPILKKEEK